MNTVLPLRKASFWGQTAARAGHSLPGLLPLLQLPHLWPWSPGLVKDVDSSDTGMGRR